MKKAFDWGITALCILGFAATGARAGEEKSLEKGITVSESSSITAVVEAIDYQARTVLLKGPRGGLVDLKVNETAKNFDRVKKGDTVTLSYYGSLLLQLEKHAQEPVSARTTILKSVPEGQKPKVVRVDAVDGLVTIEGVNAKERTVTVRNSKGEVKTYTIGEDVKDFGKLKNGHQIYYSYVQAVVLEVGKPQGKP